METEPNEIAITDFLRMLPQMPQYSPKNKNYLIAGANPLYYLDDKSQEQQVAPLAASIDWSQVSPALVFFNKTQDSGASLIGSGVGGIFFRGQSFTPSKTGIISLAQFKFKVTGTPGTGNPMNVKIYASTGTAPNLKPTGAALATSDNLFPSTGWTSYTTTTFTFSGVNKITLTAGTQYIIVVTWNDGDNSNYFSVGSDDDLTGSGNASYSSDGAAWTVDATQQFWSYIYMGGVSSTILDGNIVHTIPSTDGTYSIYAITDTTHVYGITPTSIVDLGFPDGGTHSNSGGRLAIAAQKLFAVFAAQVYKNTIPATNGGWSSAGSGFTNSSVAFMEPFLDFIALGSSSNSSTTNNLIQHFDVTSFAISAGIDLGVGFNLLKEVNYNDKYLAIAAARIVNGGVQGYAQNYLFLWDGISARYNYAMRIPGEFIDMKVVDSVLQVAVQVSSTKSCIYYLNNTSLKKSLTPQISTIAGQISSNVANPLFDFKGFLGIHLNNTSDISDPLLIFGKDDAGDVEFIHSYGRKFDNLVVGYDGILFANEYVSGGNSTVYFLPTSGTYQQLFYKSQWVPVKNPSAIDIDYETSPQSGNDAISLKIYGRGEDIIAGITIVDGVPCQSATALADINTANILNQRRTRLDLGGFVGDEMMIRLKTTNSAWNPVIKGIYIITQK